MKLHLYIMSTLLVATPLVASAQTFRSFVGETINMISYLIPLLIGLAVALFFWGLVVFIAQSGDEQAVSEGKKKMTWGVIGIFVMFSVWGLVNFVLNTLGLV